MLGHTGKTDGFVTALLALHFLLCSFCSRASKPSAVDACSAAMLCACRAHALCTPRPYALHNSIQSVYLPLSVQHICVLIFRHIELPDHE